VLPPFNVRGMLQGYSTGADGRTAGALCGSLEYFLQLTGMKDPESLLKSEKCSASTSNCGPVACGYFTRPM